MARSRGTSTWLAYGLMGVGLVLLATGAAWGFATAARPPEFEIGRLSIPEIERNVEQKLPIVVHNPNWTTIRIVGCQGNGCGPGGCVYGIEPVTLELAPGESKELFVRYKSPPVAGPFEKEFVIYSATRTLNEHRFKVTGEALGAREKEADE